MTYYNLSATVMLVTAASKIYEKQNIGIFRSNHHFSERPINSLCAIASQSQADRYHIKLSKIAG
ncbi:hypothetical protein [Microcoleus sp. A003_D6]|uniref:hypothetical protein n=1 Tax=Microcoleus sp. A003_D6 TaxID=3055266 RepID=UPI002FD03F21